MVLQYKGYNNNWIYEEAEIITHAVVYVGDVIKSYRDNKNLMDELFYKSEIRKAIDKLIREETACDSEEIVYNIGNKPIDQLTNVTVVMLEDRNKNVTHVFEDGVYLLNSRGQTVQRLA